MIQSIFSTAIEVLFIASTLYFAAGFLLSTADKVSLKGQSQPIALPTAPISYLAAEIALYGELASMIVLTEVPAAIASVCMVNFAPHATTAQSWRIPEATPEQAALVDQFISQHQAHPLLRLLKPLNAPLLPLYKSLIPLTIKSASLAAKQENLEGIPTLISTIFLLMLSLQMSKPTPLEVDLPGSE